MKSIILKLSIPIFIMNLLFFGFLPCALADLSEDDIFDIHRTHPLELLQDQYRKKKILFIGSAGHLNSHPYDLLANLLARIGQDENLKFIVLERAHDISKFYERLSTKELEDTLSPNPFPSEESKQSSLCQSPEWSYAIAKFFPLLRSVNQTRPRGKPILVKTIDGMISTRSVEWPGFDRPMRDGTCKANSIFMEGKAPTLYVASSNRERQTAQNFHQRIWSPLGPDEKAIVVYHQAHLTDKFETCAPFMMGENHWEANLGPLSWLGHFLKDHPKADQDLGRVFLDEKNQTNPHGVYKFTQRQALRYPQESWAINLSPFKDILDEFGLDMFTETAQIHHFLNGQHFGLPSLPEITDGIIWHPEADKQFPLLKSSQYLPQHCLP